jgi:transcriptional regulator with XRE-family HTH domain
MSKQISSNEMIDMLKSLVAQEGTQEKAAKKIGVTSVYLGAILRGRQDPGPSILNYLGLEKTVQVSYRKK